MRLKNDLIKYLNNYIKNWLYRIIQFQWWLIRLVQSNRLDFHNLMRLTQFIRILRATFLLFIYYIRKFFLNALNVNLKKNMLLFFARRKKEKKKHQNIFTRIIKEFAIRENVHVKFPLVIIISMYAGFS